jgi:predicted nuclease of predicted toxin-antitoxin system
MNNLPNPKDLIKSGAQFAYPIQWRRWEVINVFITQFNWKVGVEIGVNEGETVFEIAKSNPKLKLYGIDPYKVQQENILYERNISQKYNDNSLNIIKRKTLKEAFRYPNLEIIVDNSINVSKQFDKESIDFVFIDGDHSYESVKNDIKYWEPIVKENGLIMGHDYNWGDVARAVGENFTEVWIMSDNVWAASKVWLRNVRKNFNRQEK